MKTCIVSLISEQTVPNFLFIKERIMPGDELLFISSRRFEERIQWIKNALGYANCNFYTVQLKDGEEEQWDAMVSAIKKKLSPDVCYQVNLTGGTKYMMLAVHQAFREYAAEFYYIPFPKNTILGVMDNKCIPLHYRIDVAEYLTSYGVAFTEKRITESKEYTEAFFRCFVQGRLDFGVIDLLRNYRNTKKLDIQQVEETVSVSDRKPQIQGLRSFLSKIEFPLKEPGKISSEETQYITGGWFEEYVYHQVESRIHPQDIRLGLAIERPGNETSKNKHINDLDVVFTYGNKLFVIECKTGIDSQKMFNETVYKAASIKESLLGLSGNSYIFSLANGDEKLKPITKTMGIDYYDRSFFVDDTAFEEVIRNMNAKAKNG